MIHVWQPSALQADTFLVWSETIKKWQSVTGWHGVAQAVNQSYVSAKSSPSSVCFYVPTASVLSLNNHLSTSELKHLGEQGQQYLFEDMSLSPVEQLRVRHRSGVTSPKLVSKANQEFQNDDSNAKPADSTNTQSAVLYALNQTRITSLQSGAELAGFSSTAVLPDFVLLPSPELPATAVAVDTANLATSLSNTGGNQTSSPVNQSSPATTQSAHSSQSALTLRLSEHHGLAVSVLSLLPATLPNLEELILLGKQEAEIAPELQSLCQEYGIVLGLQDAQPMPVANPSKHWLNFVQAERNRLASPYLQVAMGVLLLAGMVQMLADAVQWYQYEQATVAVKQANINQFSSWFAGETLNPRVTVRTQVEPRLITTGDDAQTQLDLMNTLAPLIKQNDLTAQAIRWSDNQLSLTLISDSRAGIDNLQRTLTEQGIVSNLGAITPYALDSGDTDMNTSEATGVQAELTLPLTPDTSANASDSLALSKFAFSNNASSKNTLININMPAFTSNHFVS